MASLKIFLLAFLATSFSAPAADFPKLSLRYVADWPQLPEGVNFGITTGVGVDSANNVYVYNRGPDPVLCFDASGKYLRTWGRGLLTKSHGLAVDADDNIWVTDIGSHVVVKFNSRGRVLMVLGQKDTPGESENQFNMPTHVAFGPSGNAYVSDGYGNSRIVKFTARGAYLTAWGKQGKGPGEFNAPHALAVDGQGQVYVGDRENHRVQIFDSEGRFLTQWTHLGSPWGLFMGSDGLLYMCDGYNSRVLKLDLDGKVLGSFGQEGRAPGQFALAHHLTLGKKGELYVAEIHNWRVSKFLFD